MSNAFKRDRALTAVAAYAEHEGGCYLDEPLENQVGDLLTDLRHLCDKEKIDFQNLIERSEFHFEAEK